MRPPPACDQYRVALQADPKNLGAAASLGQCSVRDYEMVAPGGDSSRLAFRSSWTTALLALRRAIEQDASYARAYRPLFAILFADTRDGCSSVTGVCSHVASIVRDGDTVVTTPRLVPSKAPGNPYDGFVRESHNKGRANIVEARTLAERWAIVAPNDYRPHEYLGRALLRLGDAAAAVNELERAASLADAAARRGLFWDRLEALVKSDRGDDARRVLDEAVADPARDTSQLRSYTVVSLNTLLGRSRPAPVDSAVLRRNQARFDSMMRSSPPPPPPRPGFSALLAAGDTAGGRREVARMDSLLVSRDASRRRSDQMHFESARQHLALGDTAIAEARMTAIEEAFNDAPFRYIDVYIGVGAWLGNAWILSGDLAAARHRFSDAARMYGRLIGLWGGGDPALQPLVDEARAKLRSLPAR